MNTSNTLNDYYTNIALFVRAVICGDDVPEDLYLPGTQRLKFYRSRLADTHRIRIQEPNKDRKEGVYEDALAKRIFDSSHFGLLALVGGLGAGKSTAIRHVGRKHEKSSSVRRRFLVCDWIGLRPEQVESKEWLAARILKGIRVELLNRAVSSLLASNGLSSSDSGLDEHGRAAMRRVLLVNDICAAASGSPLSVPDAAVDPDLLIPGRSLTDYAIDNEAVQNLIDDRAAASARYGHTLDELAMDQDLAVDLTAAVCAFVPPGERGAPVIVVDNIDQFATDHIHYVAKTLFSMSRQVDGLKVILPVRPSSISPEGFVANVQYMYHYGPDCFQMMLRRIERYVLTRPRDHLVANKDVVPGIRMFSRNPTQDEVDALLTTSYLCAFILKAASLRLAEDPVAAGACVPNLHGDHHHLRLLQVSEQPILNLAETLGAMVGTCGRYATAHVQRYFEYMYTEEDAMDDILEAMAARRKFHLSYSRAVSAVMGKWDASETEKTSLANLFYPPPQTAPMRRLPSLVKLRILSYLDGRYRVTVREVIGELAQHGIDTSVALAALNELHQKDGLLLWFSQNYDLDHSVTDSDSNVLRQYVVVSEHGLSYWRHVAGDFEYVWFCYRGIHRARAPDRDNFQLRMHEYVRLIAELGREEWRQLAFRRSAASTPWGPGYEHAREFITLRLIYSTLQRAVGSARVAWLQSGKLGIDAYQEDIAQLVTQLCELVLYWQRMYRVAYGGAGYLDKYQTEIDDCSFALERFQRLGISKELKELCRMTRATWDTHGQLGESANAPEYALASPDFVQVMAKYGRALAEIMTAGGFDLGPLDSIAVVRAGVKGVREQWARLAALLEVEMPMFGRVFHEVDTFVIQGDALIERMKDVAASNATEFEWLNKEIGRFRDYLAQLKANEYQLEGLLLPESAAAFKKRMNAIMRIYKKMAAGLGVVGLDHLNISWQ